MTRPGLCFEDKPYKLPSLLPALTGSGNGRIILACSKQQLFSFVGGKSGHCHSRDAAGDAQKAFNTGEGGQCEVFWDRHWDCHFSLLCSELWLRIMF